LCVDAEGDDLVRAVVFEIKMRERGEVLHAEDDDLSHPCSLLVDVCGVLVKPVVVSDNEVSAQLFGQKMGQRVERQMKQIVTLPINLLRHHVESHSDARMCKDARDESFEIIEHLGER